MPYKDIVVGATEIELVPYAGNRVVLLIQNTHATAVIQVTDESGKALDGTRIFSEDLLIYHWYEGDKVERRRFVISDTASTTVHVYEEFMAIPPSPPDGGGGGPTIPPTGMGGGALFALFAGWLLAMENRR